MLHTGGRGVGRRRGGSCRPAARDTQSSQRMGRNLALLRVPARLWPQRRGPRCGLHHHSCLGYEKPATSSHPPAPGTPHCPGRQPPHLSPKDLGDLLKGCHVSTPSPLLSPDFWGGAVLRRPVSETVWIPVTNAQSWAHQVHTEAQNPLRSPRPLRKHRGSAASLSAQLLVLTVG